MNFTRNLWTRSSQLTRHMVIWCWQGPARYCPAGLTSPSRSLCEVRERLEISWKPRFLKLRTNLPRTSTNSRTFFSMASKLQMKQKKIIILFGRATQHVCQVKFQSSAQWSYRDDLTWQWSLFKKQQNKTPR